MIKKINKKISLNLFKKPQSSYHQSVYESNLEKNYPFPDFNKAVFSWIAPEYLQHPKSVKWWVAAGICFLIIVSIEAFTSNWTMLVATLVFAGVYTYTHYFFPPKRIKINISDLGIKLGHKKIPYEEIEAFWIIYDPPHNKKLYFRLKERLIPDLVIELENQDPKAIREYLETKLIEIVGVRESFSDIVLKLLKL